MAGYYSEITQIDEGTNPPQLVEAAGIPGDLCLPEDHDQDRRAEDAAELAAAA